MKKIIIMAMMLLMAASVFARQKNKLYSIEYYDVYVDDELKYSYKGGSIYIDYRGERPLIMVTIPSLDIMDTIHVITFYEETAEDVFKFGGLWSDGTYCDVYTIDKYKGIVFVSKNSDGENIRVVVLYE